MMRTTPPLLLLLLAAATTTAQEAVWAPAFRGTALRRLQDDAASINYTGRGDLAGGVTATRLAPTDAAAVEEAGARAGTGAQSPKGYSLVEDAPRCNAQLGEAYCPKPGACLPAMIDNDGHHHTTLLMDCFVGSIRSRTHTHTHRDGPDVGGPVHVLHRAHLPGLCQRRAVRLF